MSLIIIYGSRGSGKTKLATLFGMMQTKNPVYANYQIESPTFRPLVIEKLVQITDSCTVIIDEAWSRMDARRSMKDESIYLSQILNQSRKRKITMIVTTQRLEDIDIRFRTQADYIIRAFNIGNNEHQYVVLDPGTMQLRRLKMDRETSIGLQDKYDTLQLIDSITAEDMVMLSDDTDYKVNAVEEWANAIIEEFDSKRDPKKKVKFTKSNVDNFLFRNGVENKPFAKAIYDEIKTRGF